MRCAPSRRLATRRADDAPFPVVVQLACLLIAGVIGAPTTAAARGDVREAPDSSAAAGNPSIQALDAQNVHNVGNIWLNVTNFGLIGSQPGTYAPWSAAPSAQWPAGSSTEYLWSAGLWVGALRNGEPHVSTAQLDMEFRAGRGPADRMYEAHDGDAGGLRAPTFGADDDHDGEIDEDPLDGRDNDGDGLIDEDYAAISPQMFVCTYHDTDPNIKFRYPDHMPLGLSVQQTSMQWDDPLVHNFIAFNFKITNELPEPIDQVYVGLFADPDIGPRNQASAFDDMAGFWEGTVLPRAGLGQKAVKVSLGYMWDADGDQGDSEGYIGLMFLGLERTGFGTNASNRRVHPIDGLFNFRAFGGKTPFDLGGDPNNDAERYKVLDGTARSSLPPPTSTARDARISRVTNDYRFVVSTGPYGSLTQGDTIGITAALVIGRNFEGLKEAAAQAKIAFDGVWANCDNNPNTGVGGRETPHCGPEEANRRYPLGGPDSFNPRDTPCDSLCREPSHSQDPRCFARVPPDGCIWIDGDCDSTTGVNGNECLVHWLLNVPPLPPHMRLSAKENEVGIFFDDRSETVVDPRLNVVDFESYRIWRSDDWHRPAGSDLETGPDPNSWLLLAEYDVPANGIGADTGLNDIRYTPNIPQYVVEFCREWGRAHPGLPPPVFAGFTPAQLDTALSLAKGVRYYRWVDPPFTAPPSDSDPPCGPGGKCDPIRAGSKTIYRRCDSRGRCRVTAPPPRSGAHYFYSVTATDHILVRRGGALVATGRGLVGDPQSNFVFIDPPSDALEPPHYDDADKEIYVVPNPATPASMAPWTLNPNNDDPTGIKIEFHHLPAAVGTITVFTVAGDLVKRIGFDGRSGNGTAQWDLVSRNGQDVTSGVYIYIVVADDPRFKRFISKFVVVR